MQNWISLPYCVLSLRCCKNIFTTCTTNWHGIHFLNICKIFIFISVFPFSSSFLFIIDFYIIECIKLWFINYSFLSNWQKTNSRNLCVCARHRCYLFLCHTCPTSLWLEYLHQRILSAVHHLWNVFQNKNFKILSISAGLVSRSIRMTTTCVRVESVIWSLNWWQLLFFVGKVPQIRQVW